MPGLAARPGIPGLSSTSHGSLPRHRRRRLHRIPSGGRARSPRPHACASPTASITGKRQQSRHICRQSSSSRATWPTSTLRAGRSTGVDYVLHQAAIPSVPRSVKDPVTSNRANVDATLNVLVAARDAGVKRVVFAGSSSAYGDTPTLPKREDMPTSPLSPYALQKLVGEQYLPDVHAALRPRDRHDPLLQRVRSAAGSVVAVLGRDLALRDRAARGRAADDLRRRRADAATSPTSPTSSTACCAPARRRARRRSHQRRDRQAHLAQRALRSDAAADWGHCEARGTPSRGPGTCGTRWPTSGSPRRSWAISRSFHSRRAFG